MAISKEQFDSLKTGEILRMNQVAPGENGLDKLLSKLVLRVGRRSNSKEYGYDSIALNYEKNKAVSSARSRINKVTLYKREGVVSIEISVIEGGSVVEGRFASLYIKTLSL